MAERKSGPASPQPATPRLKRLRRYLVAGLLVWLPLLVTLFVVRFLVNLMDRSLLLLPPASRPDNLLGFHIPGLGIILTLLLLAGTGMLAANLAGRRLVSAWEGLLARIPLIRSVYSGVKRMAEQVLSDEARTFRQVVLIEFPRKGVWSVAFQTAPHIPVLHESLPPDLVCVFLPTTPNVTTGFVFLLPREEVLLIDMPADDALKLIMSLGVVPPSARTGAAGAPLAPSSAPP
jgi:uncharacterized membrane protein